PPTPTVFPYTTLFRSRQLCLARTGNRAAARGPPVFAGAARATRLFLFRCRPAWPRPHDPGPSTDGCERQGAANRRATGADERTQIGRAHVCTPVTVRS